MRYGLWALVATYAMVLGSVVGCGKGFKVATEMGQSNFSSSAGELKITEPVDQSYTQASATIKGTCIDGTSVEFSGDFAPVSSEPCVNQSFSKLINFSSPDGDKIIEVLQRFGGGQRKHGNHFKRDTRPPVLVIISPAQNASVKDSVVIQGTCEAGLQVKIDSGFVPCAANGMFATTVPLTQADGALSLALSSVDAAGNMTNVTLALKKDTVAPVVNIAAPATGAAVQVLSLNISGSCESGVAVNISGAGIAAPVNGACTNGAYSIAAVVTAGTGVKSFTAAQTDAAGNSGSASSNVNYAPAANPPAIAITAPAMNAVFKDTLTVSGTCQSGMTVNFSGTGWTAPASTTCTNGMFSAVISFTAGDGAKNLVASQTDAGATGSASRTFVRDLTPPALSIANPAAGTTAKTGVSLAGACESGLNVSISGSGVSAASSVSCASGAYSAAIGFSAGDGIKTVVVSQTDAVGNVASVSRDFMRDGSSPVLTISSPAAGVTAKTGVTLTGACENGLGISISGTGVAAASSASCANNAYSAAINFSNGDGTKSVTVAQTDAVGNTTSVSRDFVRDTTAPAPHFTSPAAGTSAETQLAISGTCEGNFNVIVSGDISPNVTQSCANGTFSMTVQFSANDGTKNVTVSQTDAVGNTGSETRAFTRAALVLDGAALYTQNCSGCHGALAVSVKRGRTAAQITTALGTISAMSTINLTSAQISAIAAALAIPVSTACTTQTDPGREPLHRLNKDEYSNAVNAVLGISGSPGALLPEENVVFGFSNIAAALTVSPTSVSLYLDAAEAAVAQAFTSNSATVFTCSGSVVAQSTLTKACAQQILTRIAQAAYRRPLSSAESTQVTGFVDTALAQGQSNLEGLRWGLEFVLTTPSFLFRSISHPSPNDPAVIKSLTGYELASRLSFFLWSSQPDQSLLTVAADNTLAQTAVLENQVTRMLADPKAKALVDGFAAQWLQLHRFEMHTADPAYYPAFTETIKSDMKTETNMLLNDVFLKDQSPMLLVNSSSSYLNRRLASYYGVSGPTSDTNFVKTSMTGTERRGLIGQGSVLVSTSLPARTSVVRRGKWILDEMLCEPPGDPPSNVDLGAIPGNSGGSVRQQLEAHRANPVCASCHNKIDPLGFALENFDADAKWRLKYRDNTNVDSTGTLPDGKTVSGALSLAQILSADPRYKTCVTKKLMTYALGRSVADRDQCTVDRLSQQNVGDGIPFSSLVKAIVTSDPFRKQTGGQ